ncbi:MAG: RluA family pseudouridine synthase [Deltaproteobacteria bacterium]|nr:RluA family pseudouridine synthase [Deltaproteobacteria bacterium]MCB9788862.1 RluA family pseudouridine synthase [Deltaproteobacteria bacterium]
MSDGPWTVPPVSPPPRLAGFLREALGERPWREVKRWISTGKVQVDGEVERDPGRTLRAGDRVALHMETPRRAGQQDEIPVVYWDAHVIVVDKPEGVTSVPYDEDMRDTALSRAQTWLRSRTGPAPPLRVVHRIDKDTSGLLVFARTRLAERELANQLRLHAMERRYLCVCHGRVGPARIESMLVPDRGDGLRGSSTRGQGKRAVTHVEPVESLAGATLCRVRLETGRTHQIRIQLAEAGHPLVGERVYIRDHLRAGRVALEAERLLLHAATLGFAHPVGGAPRHFEAPLPPAFEAALAALRRP